LKKVIIVLILMFNYLFALDRDSTIKIYNKIITSIFVTKKPLVYVANKEYHDILKFSKKITIVNRAEKASIAIVTTKEELDNLKKINPNIMIFVTKENLLFYDTSVIGAFYWKKGRSQLIFIKNRLERYHIHLPKEYNQFIIEL